MNKIIKQVQTLEDFLLADLGQPWSSHFIKANFEVCKNNMESAIKNQDTATMLFTLFVIGVIYFIFRVLPTLVRG